MEWPYRPPEVVVMGGGTGPANLLPSLREFTSHITAIVSPFDNGGSTGRLREEYGILAPGDIRRALGALAGNKELSAWLETRREDGHTLGNLMLVEHIEEANGDLETAIANMQRRLGAAGTVIPVSLDPTAQLVMHHYDKIVVGEHAIDTYPISDPHAHISTTTKDGKPATVNPAATKAIETADLIVIAPGSPLTSLAAVLAPEGMSEALRYSRGTLVAIANLAIDGNYDMAERHVADHVRELERYTGRPIDVVIYNTDVAALSTELKPLAHDAEPFSEIMARTIGRPLVGKFLGAKSPFDTVSRDHIVHDAQAVLATLKELLGQQAAPAVA